MMSKADVHVAAYTISNFIVYTSIVLSYIDASPTTIRLLQRDIINVAFDNNICYWFKHFCFPVIEFNIPAWEYEALWHLKVDVI